MQEHTTSYVVAVAPAEAPADSVPFEKIEQREHLPVDSGTFHRADNGSVLEKTSQDRWYRSLEILRGAYENHTATSTENRTAFNVTFNESTYNVDLRTAS